MKLTIDTKEDSHDDLRKVIKMIQHIIGDSQEVLTNQPSVSDANIANPFANIFGDSSSASGASSESTSTTAPSTGSITQNAESAAPASESTEDLFAELFSEEEIKKMDSVKTEEDEGLETKPKDKKYNIEFY